MLNKISSILLLLSLILSFISFGQRGKDSYINTINTTSTILNTYTSVTTNASAGQTSLTVASNLLNGAQFTGNLAAGDLIMIIQMQGASLNIDVTPTVSWGGNYTVIPAYLWTYNSNSFGHEYGTVTNYANAGNYEIREVLSVAGASTINLTCGLEKNYTASGRVQVIRVPRLQNLTLNTGASIVSPAWNGSTGGIVALEVNGNLTLNANSLIDVSNRGFRGALTEGASLTGSTAQHSNGAGNGSTFLGSNQVSQGARKGEGIGGNQLDYQTTYLSHYGTGAMANGGGGGGYQNGGGGGGANIGTGTRTGKGIATPGYATAWNLESPGMGTLSSPGGGRGGYSLAESNQNELTLGPNQSAWGGDARKENGGYGGTALAYDVNRLFMGGGGGAGGQDSGQGGSGGNGGGIIFVTVYGNISGSGTIRANGQNGINSNPAGQSTPGYFSNAKLGNDGAGGGGGGGYVYIKNMNPLPASISIQANGGDGGDQDLRLGGQATKEVGGPGAAGAGGGIALTSGIPVQSVLGGSSGMALERVTLFNGSESIGDNSLVTNFPPNGATNGGNGISNLPTQIFDIITTNDTICGSQTATLTASIIGTPPGSPTLQWYTVPFGGVVVNTGTTYNVSPAVTTTYYVGFCPSTFRKPVTVVVGANPTISGTANITDATCNTLGSITGLSALGGTGTLDYTWNGLSSPGANLSNASAGNYTLVVTDDNGCTASSGPHTINGVGGPVINGTAVITNETCSTPGSITGLSATGIGTLSYEWNSVSTPSADLSNATSGNYTLIVTDGNGCTASSGPYSITMVAGPTINGTAVIVDENCNNLGSISGLSASGGVGTYSYAWNGTSSPNSDLSAGAAGNYTLIVTDDNGCNASSGPHTIGFTALPTITGTAVIVNATCTAQGSISGLTGNGSGPLSFTWNGNPSPSENFTGVAGNYTLEVTDVFGCSTTSGPHTIGTTPGPSITGTVAIVDQTCTTLGSISGLSATGGVAPYGYAWNANPSVSPNLSNAVAGNYTLTVVDINGCTATSGPHTINATGGPSITGTAVIVSATCTSGGSISGLSASGGTGPYTYEWNGNTTPNENLNNATPGNYTLEVTDANGCVATSGPYTINAPVLPIINGVANIVDATCTDGGSITGLSASGGSTPYIFEWNAVITPDANLSNAAAGNYTLTVTDANGCAVQSGPYTINSAGGPTINGSVNIVDATCTVDGNITGLNATGGSAPYSFMWNATPSANENLLNAPAGSYTLTVTDDNGCTTQSGPHVINEIPGPTINGFGNITSATCNAGGSIENLTVTGGTAPYIFMWNGMAQPDEDLLNIPAGSYTFSVEDANGCVETAGPFVVPVLGGPTANFTFSPQNPVMNQVVTFTDASTGNIVDWTWDIDNSIQTDQNVNYTFTQEGFYDVTLTIINQAGCVDVVTITVQVFSDLVVPNVITPNHDGVNDFFEIGGLLPNTKLTIINRWGNLIFETDDYKNDWNGYDYSGNKVLEGVYTYLVTLPDGNQKHGFVHVEGAE